MKKPVRLLTEEDRKIISAVSEWKATPLELRPYKSLAELAEAHAFNYSRVLRLADTVDTYSEMLVHVAGDAIGEAPAILRKLAERAKDGHVRAAEVYLGFVRQTLTDQSFLAQVRKQAPEIVLKSSLEIAQHLLEVAKSVRSPEDLQHLRTPVEGDYEVGTWNTFLESEAQRQEKKSSPIVVTD